MSKFGIDLKELVDSSETDDPLDLMLLDTFRFYQILAKKKGEVTPALRLTNNKGLIERCVF